MSTLQFFITNYIKAKKIKLAVGSRCEVCQRALALDDLVIHTFIDEEQAEQHPPTDLEGFLLVLCSWCHDDVHAFGAPVEEQDMLARQRPDEIRRAIREILTYIPRPYTPPESDLEDAYREACSSRFRFGV